MNDLLRLRIYYEDTDCGGVVYYANYLKYAERARTEFLESRGLDMKSLMDEGIIFVVVEASLKYRSPARYGDTLAIETRLETVSHASLLFSHRMYRDLTGETLVEAAVRLCCVGRDLRPMRLGAHILRAVGPDGPQAAPGRRA